MEGILKLHIPGQKAHDLSKVKIEGVYVLDMIAHNRDRDRNVFQISPGISWQSAWLAYQAHLANMVWNARADQWNRRPERLHRGDGRRSKDGVTIPDVARYPRVRGEVRLPRDMRKFAVQHRRSDLL